MRTITSLLFALLACAAFAFTFGVSTNAQALEELRRAEDCIDCGGFACYDDWDCPSGYSCEYGECRAAQCGYYSHYDNGPVLAVFDVDPGSYIVVPGSGINSSDYKYCGSSCGSMIYRSQAHINKSQCNSGQSCFPKSSCPEGMSCAMAYDPGYTFYHSHGLRSGKYRVSNTYQICSANGRYVLELTPCNC